MPKHLLRTRLAVIASLSLLTIGAAVSGTVDHSSTTGSQTSTAASLQLLPSGVFGWD